ncbi:hypothetical protein K0M31_005886, partial [Melipona bicolor]
RELICSGLGSDKVLPIFDVKQSRVQNTARMGDRPVTTTSVWGRGRCHQPH